MQDFRNYRTEERKVLTKYYHGRKIVTLGAPASGALLIEALNILEQYNIGIEGETLTNIHR
jgi:gamma-glutamyltranspeptidase